jgi:hypothetical protein
MKVALNPAELQLIVDALDDKHQFGVDPTLVSPAAKSFVPAVSETVSSKGGSLPLFLQNVLHTT